MKTHLVLPITLLSLISLPSCADTSKKTTETPPAEMPIQSTPKSKSYGKVVYMKELVTRNESATSTLTKTLQDNPKVVLDFYAEWCGPCKKLSPVLDKLAAKYPDVLFIKINVDEFENISSDYSIKGIPALFFFKDGKRVEKTSGYKSESELKSMIEKLN